MSDAYRYPTGLASGQPLRSAAFRWFLVGQSISMAGSAMAPVALAFGVLEVTESAAWLSAVTTAALVPMVATLLLGGGIADHYRRDTVLFLTSLGAGLTQAGVAFVLLAHQHPVFLLPLAALNGVFQGLTKPALRGIVSNLAAGRGLQQASSVLRESPDREDRSIMTAPAATRIGDVRSTKLGCAACECCWSRTTTICDSGSPPHCVPAGLAVDAAADLPQADEALFVTAYDCAVFDRMLPSGDAATYVETMRRGGREVPVLFLTARDSVADRVEGFASGGDDYLIKPFAVPELVARVRSLCRRSAVVRPPVHQVGELEIDTARRRVHRAGVLLTLTSREFAVLEMLATRADQAVSRSELLESCWDEMAEPQSNVLDVLISQLRRKLGEPPLIHTVRGVGYRLAADGSP